MKPADKLRSRLRHASASLVNVAKLVSGRRFTSVYQTRFSVVHRTDKFSLRHYETDRAKGSPVLLVPPLMVTAEIYDMSPDLSAVLWLLSKGYDVWSVDFGTPDATPEGLEKTLADHVLAVSAAVDCIVEKTQKNVHLLGYSQGGMFVYQTAAFRRCKGIASCITLGSPVDLLRNLPVAVKPSVLSGVLHSAERLISRPLEEVPFLPGWITSIGFKLASPRQELRHFLLMLRLLDDEEALKRMEPTRRFLGGEGFVAWPGPALRNFVEEFVVHNRMVSGGFVIAGRTVSLSDIDVPVLYFRGLRDDFARPRAVSAVERVVPHDEVYGATIDTGHLGLLVGTRAQQDVWPTIDEWLRFRDQQGPKPERIGRLLSQKAETQQDPHVLRLLSAGPRALWAKVGNLTQDLNRATRFSRWQLPRLLRLLRVWDGAEMSLSATLKAQARAIPDHSFLLWEGRAYTYAEADRRVTHIAAALFGCGVRSGQTVGLLFDNHPDCLTALAAANRLGVTVAILNPSLRGAALSHALSVTGVRDLISLREAPDVGELDGVRRLLIGQGEAQNHTRFRETTLDLEAIDAVLPPTLPLDAGQAKDIACLMFTSGTTGKPKAVKISNRRWVLAATAAAVGCDLNPTDTVYCCLPLHHGTGLLLAASGALLGGCRLAIAPRFSVRQFWEDVRRTGTTVVFYVGELCRYLVSAPPSPLERSHSVRLFVGNGMRPEVWKTLLHRFGSVSVLEFYAATEGNVVMTNVTGEKIGSVGRVPFGVVRTLTVKYDPATETYPKDSRGFLIPCEVDEPGMLLVEIRQHNPLSRFDGYTEPTATEKKILRNVLKSGDAWFCSGDLLREDADGDYWFVDRVGDTFRWKGENVSTEQVAAVLALLPFVEMCAVYGVKLPGQEGRAGMAAIKLRREHAFDPKALFACVEHHLIDPARPRFVRLVADLATTETLKINKQPLLADGIDVSKTGPLFVYDKGSQSYVELDVPLNQGANPQANSEAMADKLAAMLNAL